VRDQSSRWGSCSNTGVLSFSWRLIFAPPFVLDYLAAHEVSHLVELNHSPRFWRLVNKLYPDFERAKVWLDVRHRPAATACPPSAATISEPFVGWVELFARPSVHPRLRVWVSRRARPNLRFATIPDAHDFLRLFRYFCHDRNYRKDRKASRPVERRPAVGRHGRAVGSTARSARSMRCSISRSARSPPRRLPPRSGLHAPTSRSRSAS
jgi:hypothetical protein